MFRPSLIRWSLMATCLLAGPVAAQPSIRAVPAALAASVPAWRSAFDGYRPFDDAPVAAWRASNDTVGRIGGWRAYAREAQEALAAPAPTPPSPTTGPAPAAAPAAGHRH